MFILYVFVSLFKNILIYISLQGQNERNNMIVESWSGTKGKQSYSYLIKNNSTVSFTWGFQRTGTFSMVRPGSFIYK